MLNFFLSKTCPTFSSSTVHHSFFAGVLITHIDNQDDGVFVAIDIENKALLDPLKLSIVETNDIQELIDYLLKNIITKQYKNLGLDHVIVSFRLFHRADEKAPQIENNKHNHKPLTASIKVK